jgi:hypothetical protein
MHNSAPARHPLHVTGADHTLVAQTVGVARLALEHVRHGLYAAMWMHREPLQGAFGRVIEGEVVEEQEGIEGIGACRAEGAQQVHPRALEHLVGVDNMDCLTSFLSHGCPPDGSHLGIGLS